jgi:hypothetical protein
MRVDGRARPRDETNVRLLFAINVPIGIVTFLISTRLLPYTPPSKHRFDLPTPPTVPSSSTMQADP